jgi:hypothetical protein
MVVCRTILILKFNVVLKASNKFLHGLARKTFYISNSLLVTRKNLLQFLVHIFMEPYKIRLCGLSDKNLCKDRMRNGTTDAKTSINH